MKCFTIELIDGRLYLTAIDFEKWKSTPSVHLKCICIEDPPTLFRIPENQCLSITGKMWKKEGTIKPEFLWDADGFERVGRSDKPDRVQKYLKFVDEYFVSDEQKMVKNIPKYNSWTGKDKPGTVDYIGYHIKYGKYLKKDYVPYDRTLTVSNFVIKE